MVIRRRAYTRGTSPVTGRAQRRKGAPVTMSEARSADLRVARPATPLLIDSLGRVARDLRVSLTEKCSLRCTYCMPEEGLPPIPDAARMTTEEVVRLVALAHRELSVHEVRFTGGEPLMRQDLETIIAGTRAECPDLPIAMTTNGVGLEHRIDGLVEAGLDRINISLDTVNRAEFAELTRRDRLPSVLRGVRAAVAAGVDPVKVNAVPMRATLAGAPDLLEWALVEGVNLRFIEEMPLDADNTWSRVEMVTAQEVLESLGTRFDLIPAGREDPSAPAELWEVGRDFCGAGDRPRLTAEGTVRSCLFGDNETDVLGVLRSGAPDEEVADVWRGAMWGKQAGHGIGEAAFHRPRRSMGAIGG